MALSTEALTRAVIFIDESHYASQRDSLVYKFLRDQVGVTADGHPDQWRNQDVVLISISATPMAEIANLGQAGGHGGLSRQAVCGVEARQRLLWRDRHGETWSTATSL